MTLPRTFGARLPDWVLAEVGTQTRLATPADRMELVLRLAARNPVEGTGGPFAALVVESGSGRLVSAGVNLVLAAQLSAAHAEVVALSLAQVATGSWNLGAPGEPEHELVVNWRPCAQCYGATMWSGVSRLVVAGEGPELEALTGFDEGPMREDWIEQFTARGIEVVVGVGRERALEVFEDYGALVRAQGATVYNPR